MQHHPVRRTRAAGREWKVRNGLSRCYSRTNVTMERLWEVNIVRYKALKEFLFIPTFHAKAPARTGILSTPIHLFSVKHFHPWLRHFGTYHRLFSYGSHLRKRQFVESVAFGSLIKYPVHLPTLADEDAGRPNKVDNHERQFTLSTTDNADCASLPRRWTIASSVPNNRQARKPACQFENRVCSCKRR